MKSGLSWLGLGVAPRLMLAAVLVAFVWTFVLWALA
jgi:hypothetical protein